MYDDVVYCEVISRGFMIVRRSSRSFASTIPTCRWPLHATVLTMSSLKSTSQISRKTKALAQIWRVLPFFNGSGSKTEAMASTLRAANIFTVDVLAELPDTKLSASGQMVVHGARRPEPIFPQRRTPGMQRSWLLNSTVLVKNLEQQ